MRNARYFNSFAPLAALGAGGLAGYCLIVRPWSLWSEPRAQDRARGRVPSPRPSPRGRGGVGQGVSTPSSFRG
jgi:hypothetical protein